MAAEWSCALLGPPGRLELQSTGLVNAVWGLRQRPILMSQSARTSGVMNSSQVEGILWHSQAKTAQLHVEGLHMCRQDATQLSLKIAETEIPIHASLAGSQPLNALQRLRKTDDQ